MRYVKLRRPFRGKLGFYQPLRNGVVIPEEEKLPPGAEILDKEGGKVTHRINDKGEPEKLNAENLTPPAHVDPVKPNATNIREAAKPQIMETLGAGEKDPQTIADLAKAEAQAELFAKKFEPAKDADKAKK